MQGENRNLAAKADQLRAANDDAEARIARLYAILKMLERARYGRRSEALDEDQQRFVFDEIQTGLAAIEAKLEADPERVRTSTVRKALPAHLERIEEIIEPDPVPCACGSCSRVKDRRGRPRAARCCPVALSGHRHPASPLRLHRLPREHRPRASARTAHRSRPADGGASRPCRRLQIRRRSASVPSGGDLRPGRRRDRPQRHGRLDGPRRLPPRATRRPHSRTDPRWRPHLR